ncbi:hypothetical protein [Nocardioides caldifontis]|uniref:hypothetical protein n=1 Tax=Nocardioides caldifontis TaxID=2588938 RepID=UPI0011DFBBF6|nr:hypothetical protein [Nocardioides caldifontis]
MRAWGGGAVAAAAAALVLSGCGADSGSTAARIAERVGCTGYETSNEQIFVTESGSCRIDGRTVELYYFADRAARDTYVDIAAEEGGLYLVGPDFAVQADRSTLETLQAQHGYDLRG